MISKNAIKYIQSLQQKKIRQKNEQFIIEGDKMARELLAQQFIRIEKIYALSAWMDTNESILAPFMKQIEAISEQELKQISSLSTPNEVLIVAKMPMIQPENLAIETDFCLYLDEIQDPGNMGTILRIADWFGIQYVFCSNTCVDVYNSKVIQSTMGAFMRVKTLEIDFETLIEKMPNFSILGATMDGESIYTYKKTAKTLLVIGNEGKGISEKIQSKINKWIAIPKGENGGAESLNAAVATGILCAFLK